MWRDELDDYSDYERDLDLMETDDLDAMDEWERWNDACDDDPSLYCGCDSCRKYDDDTQDDINWNEQ